MQHGRAIRLSEGSVWHSQKRMWRLLTDVVASSYDAARVSGDEGVTVILLSVSVTTVGSVNGETVFVAETPCCACVCTRS